MKATLGLVRWEAFVQDARDSYYETFLKRFTRTDKRIACAGRLTGTRKSCPLKFSLDIGGKNLSKLHLDHEFDLNQVCAIWKSYIVTLDKTTKADVKDWSGPKMSKKLLLWLLLDALEFRCFNGNVNTSCHAVDASRYERVLDQRLFFAHRSKL